MARVSAPRLEELVREAEVLSTLKASVPHAWKILEHEIDLARLAAASDRPPPPHTPRQSVRKRVKLRVPAEKYPDYNFVGRLLGPRGATLKRLERDTACRIMIRGKGSIRKDKEAEVRGKPGWEHVFNEPLHVVIEVVDAADDATANRILSRAKELVDLLLVPVPEERDSLKRAQLRDLAILNGTHRSVADLIAPHHAPLSSPRASPAASPPPPNRRPSQGPKHPPKPLYNPGSIEAYMASFDSAQGVSFARPISQPQYSQAMSPPPASSPSQHSTYPPVSSPAFPAGSPRESASYLPELDKLRIPSLNFDHLSENNITMNSFGMPNASPTIVDPDIYPYPPTPGLLNVDHQIQLNAFASPVWTPNRPMQNGPLSSSSALPPRSPRAPDSNQQSSSFLLGRGLGEPARPQGAFQRSASLMEGEISIEEAFASHATVGDERDFNSQPHFVSRDAGPGGSQSGFNNFFPQSPVLNPHHSTSHPLDQERFELRQSHSQNGFAQPRDEASQGAQQIQLRVSQQSQAQRMPQHQDNLRAERQQLEREQGLDTRQLRHEHQNAQMDALLPGQADRHSPFQPVEHHQNHHH